MSLIIHLIDAFKWLILFYSIPILHNNTAWLFTTGITVLKMLLHNNVKIYKSFFKSFTFRLSPFPINPLTTNVPYHIETSQLICNSNQLTDFYMTENIGR